MVKKRLRNKPVSRPLLIEEKWDRPQTIWQRIWLWGVVWSITSLILGGGVTFMISAHLPYLADLFFLIGLILLLIKFLTWEPLKKLPQRKIFKASAIVIDLGILAGIIYSNHYLNKEQAKILVSPSEFSMEYPMDKNFILSITNDQDFAIYNVNLGMCINYRTGDDSWIYIDSLKGEEEIIPNSQVEMGKVTLSNGCAGLVFGRIGPRKEKRFNVTIKGDKVRPNAKVAFRVYNWYQEPYFESARVNKNYALKDHPLPKTFNEIFDDRFKPSDKSGHVYRFKMKLPTNPFFPQDKPDPKEYWLAAFFDG